MFKFTSFVDAERCLSGGRFGSFPRAVALLAVVGGGGVLMTAQTKPASSSQIGAAARAQSSLSSDVAMDGRLGEALFSSSAAEQAAPMVSEAFVVPTSPNFAEMMQYGGGQRKRYGRPRYRGNNTNGDGSSKWIFFGGAGLSQPIGNTWRYLTPSYAFQVGGGRQFSNRFAMPVQFDYDHFGFTKQTLNNQTVVLDAVYGGGSLDGILDGTSHVWSFTVDPTLTFYSGETLGAYVVAGAGFYHKTASFTTPSTQQSFNPYYGPYQYTANQAIDKYTSNAPGFSGGFGLTYKFSRFATERFYAEARYVFVDNSQRQGITVDNLNSLSATSTNFYPANSNRTTYIPITVGIRF
jgi:hypothetical protein